MTASAGNPSRKKPAAVDMTGPRLPIYLDYQATTPVDPRVMEVMLPFFTEKFGNPHAVGHRFGWEAEEALNLAREQVAAVIGATAREIVFTSGATESCNLAIKGAARFHAQEGGKKRHIITLATEHKCVLASYEDMNKEGFEISILPVTSDGLVDLELLEKTLRDDTLLVSVMAVNNEIGVIQPLAEIGVLCRARGVLFHTDAAQGFGKIPLDVEAMNIDLLSISGHKIYAPKGIGALYVRRRPRVRLLPLLSGGVQEWGMRPGTAPVPLVVALGKAAEIAAQEMESEQARLSGLRNSFWQSVQEECPHVLLNGSLEQRIGGNLNLSFPGIAEDKMVLALRDLAVSTGSACNSASLAPSYVIQALGRDAATAKTTVRFGFGRFTTPEETDYAARLVIEKLRVLKAA